ncbi:MAG: proprotein convertase P-domain-containing protein [Phycisphaerales bacterium]|nr:MAG: proprotein convertase P-domain-containing protein [Phycisphaerales bacterium]
MEVGGRVRPLAIASLAVLFCARACGQPVHVYSGLFDLRIPADPDSSKGWMSDAVIEVPDHLGIVDLDIGITLTHTKVLDLQIFVESPSAERLCLNMYNPFDEYFEGEDYIQTIFDDEAGTPIEEATPPFTGRFSPLSPGRLDVFDDEDAFGLWRLQIYDAFYADVGQLDSFQLLITVPEPATVVLFLVGTVWVTAFRSLKRMP